MQHKLPDLSVMHPSVPVPGFSSPGQWYSTQVEIITGSSPALSNVPVSPHSVTAQQYSVHPTKYKIPLSAISHSAFRSFLPIFTPSPTSFYPHLHSVFIFQEDVCTSVCVCASAPFSAGQRPTSSPAALPYPPLLWLIQILLSVLCCSSFFRLKAMCHSLLLSLCLFLHLFLLLPPTQSLSPLPTTFSLVSVDVVVCKLLTACVSFCIC